MKAVTTLLAIAVAVAASPAVAANTNVPFTGTIISTCTLTVGTAGELAPNAAYSVLGSKEAGGTSGAVTIISTGATFHVTADAPSAFSQGPAGANTSTTFVAEYKATGVTSTGQLLGTTSTLVNPGVTNLQVDLTATKSAGVFGQGFYQAEVVVRCE